METEIPQNYPKTAEIIVLCWAFVLV